MLLYMSNHFTSIGFASIEHTDLEDCLIQAEGFGQRVITPHGSLLRWSLEGGPEFWFQFNPKNEVVSFNPDFAGESATLVTIERLYPKSASSPLDGAFLCQYTPNPTDPPGTHVACPFICDVSDFDAHCTLKTPIQKTLRRSGFAEELFIVEDARELADWIAHPDNAPSGFYRIPQYAIFPVATMELDNPEKQQDPDFPNAANVISGVVLNTEMRANSYTNLEFYWALVDTAAGPIDLVIDPEWVTRPLKVGTILQASLWMTGRIV
jgi:hypothetical protein